MSFLIENCYLYTLRHLRSGVFPAQEGMKESSDYHVFWTQAKEGVLFASKLTKTIENAGRFPRLVRQEIPEQERI